mmetsp:Transcript_121868/g.339686  ORF Transcript_121868/g.339686 Transcript_121868/m.339686 type:complete len:265 (+) Transcript_121868:1-795(+)
MHLRQAGLQGLKAGKALAREVGLTGKQLGLPLGREQFGILAQQTGALLRDLGRSTGIRLGQQHPDQVQSQFPRGRRQLDGLACHRDELVAGCAAIDLQAQQGRARAAVGRVLVKQPLQARSGRLRALVGKVQAGQRGGGLRVGGIGLEHGVEGLARLGPVVARQLQAPPQQLADQLAIGLGLHGLDGLQGGVKTALAEQLVDQCGIGRQLGRGAREFTQLLQAVVDLPLGDAGNRQGDARQQVLRVGGHRAHQQLLGLGGIAAA